MGYRAGQTVHFVMQLPAHMDGIEGSVLINGALVESIAVTFDEPATGLYVAHFTLPNDSAGKSFALHVAALESVPAGPAYQRVFNGRVDIESDSAGYIAGQTVHVAMAFDAVLDGVAGVLLVDGVGDEAVDVSVTLVTEGVPVYDVSCDLPDDSTGKCFALHVAGTAGATAYYDVFNSVVDTENDGLPSYLTAAEARSLAAKLPATAVTSIAASSDAMLTLALAQASSDVDLAGPYTGRKYETDQVLEFPRYRYTTPMYRFFSTDVFDWDSTNHVPVVPQTVQLAVVHQAESILKGDREERADARHDGVVSQSADGLSEAYAGERPVLCRRAGDLMERYRLRSGELI